MIHIRSPQSYVFEAASKLILKPQLEIRKKSRWSFLERSFHHTLFLLFECHKWFSSVHPCLLSARAMQLPALIARQW